MTIILNPACNSCDCQGAFDSAILLGGEFTTVGGTTRRYAAALDPDTYELFTWNPNIQDDTGSQFVESYGIDQNNLIYLIGSMKNLGPGSNTDLLLPTMQTNGTRGALTLHVDSTVNDIAIDTVNQIIYFVGAFTTVGGTTRNRAAAVDFSGNLQAWNPNLGNEAYGVLLHNGVVYIVGNFTTADGGTTRNYACAFDTAGVLQAWNPNLSDYARTLREDAGLIYIGGTYQTVSGGTTRRRLSAWSTAGVLQAWNPDVTGTATAEVEGMSFLNSILYFGGSFTAVGGTARTCLAAIDTSGVLQSWAPVPGSASNYFDTILADDTIVYLGGSFSTIDGTARSRAAAVDTSGTLTSFNPNLNGVCRVIRKLR